MARVDWEAVMNGGNSNKHPYAGANVRFFNAYLENAEKSLKEGRPIFDEIPSISIRWPGQDETVTRIEPHHIAMFQEKYQQFKAGNEPVTEGTPIAEWPLMSGTAMRELQYMGFRTVEQLAAANDEVKRKLGPLAKFIKLASDWLDAANSTQNDVVKLKAQLDKANGQIASLTHKLELFMQRVEANEGTKFDKASYSRPEPEVDLDDEIEEEQVAPRPRGRPKSR